MLDQVLTYVAVRGRYTDRIFDFVWIKDFAAARQYSFAQATGDWIFCIDADDVVQGAAEIRPLLGRTPAQVGLVCWRYQGPWDKHGNLCIEYWRERCVRNDGRSTWEGRVHEELCAGGDRQYSQEVVIEHRQEAVNDSLERDAALMEIVLQEEDDRPKWLYCMGQAYEQAGKIDQALALFQRCVDRAEQTDECYQGLLRIAQLLRRQMRFDEALRYDTRALKMNPALPYAYFGLAQSHYFLQDWERVVHWCVLGKMRRPPHPTNVHNPMMYRFDWIIWYTLALQKMGKYADALRWTREVLAIVPDDPQHLAVEAFLRSELEEQDRISREAGLSLSRPVPWWAR